MNALSQKLLLVDDDEALLQLLKEYLEQEGFTIDTLHDGASALAHVQQDGQYDVIVLDIMMPGPNGLEVLQQLRQHIHTPVIMLTGRGDDIDRIIGLEMGADDYLAKPCNPRELLARIRSVLRRSQASTAQPRQSVINAHGILMDASKQQVSVNDQPLEVTGVEFQVLLQLMQSAGTALSKEVLTRNVLHREMTPYDRSIDVHVSRIRKKLDDAFGTEQQLIKTLRGQGYLFIS